MAQAAEPQLPLKRRGKSEAAFRTISEVAADLEVPQHVLRFWETKFIQIRPMKRGGGRRYYRPEDVELLRRIRSLLYDDGYTIKGVQKLLRQGAGRLPAGGNGREPEAAEETEASEPAPSIEAAPAAEAAAAPAPQGLSEDQRRELAELLFELQDLSRILRGSGG